MFARSSLPVFVGFICLLGIFLVGRDSRHAAADPQPPHAPADHPAGAENPRTNIFPILNLLLLADEATCVQDADCDDGDVCNGLETCVAGVCQPGPPLVCDDGNICTDNTCDPTLGCVFVNNTAPCDDGDACTTNDTCSGGVCVGGPWLECDNGNPCTIDWCDAATGCNHLCIATGQDDPCCQDPLCSSSPTCQFAGGVYVNKVTGLSQQPLACFLGPLQHGALMALLESVEVPIYLPPESAYPTTLTLGIPFLGDLEVMARFEDGEIHFDEVVLDPIHLSDFFAFLPPEFDWLADEMQCVIDAKATGWTLGLDTSGFLLTVLLYDLVVTREYPGSSCVLYGKPVNPSCQMNFTVTGTRYVP